MHVQKQERNASIIGTNVSYNNYTKTDIIYVEYYRGGSPFQMFFYAAKN